MTTHILSLPSIINTQQPNYGNLPNEDAYNLAASLYERAASCNRPFNLQILNISSHPVGFCVGLSDTANNAIAIFYVANGLYVWSLRSLIHVIVPNARLLTAKPLQVGMNYLFGPSNLGFEYVRAEPWGMAGRLKDLYFQQHSELQATKKAGKSKSGSDESDGAPPVNHPRAEDLQPIKSLDELGL